MIRRLQCCRGPLMASALLFAPEHVGSQTVVDEVEVSVIELDVTVRDRKGRVVSGLAREDFSVSASGVPLEITNFRAATRTASAPDNAGEPAPLGSPEPRYLVLYFDETSLDGGERAELGKNLTTNLEQGLAPGARIMVAGRQGFELRIYQPFTDKPELLTAAVDRALRGAPHNPTSAHLSEFLREIERALSAIDDAPRASARARSRVLAARGTTFVSEALQTVARSADVFEQLILTLGGLSGRAGLLYVGDGLAVNPGEVIGGALRDAFSRFEMRSVSDSIDSTSATSLGRGRLADVAERAASRQLTVYALDTSGRQVLTLATAEYRSMDAGRSGGVAPIDTWAPGISSRRRSEIQNALQTVAEATGGRLLTDRRSDLLEVLVEDLGSYYSLGVQAPLPFGTPSRLKGTVALEVTVKGRGLRVHHRRASPPRSIDAIDADRTVAALLGGIRADFNSLGASVTIGEITARGTGEDPWAVPLVIRVPVAALRVRARASRHEGQLSIFVATRDARRHLSEVRKTVLPVGLANSDLATAVGRDAEYRLELLLPAGRAQVAVAVRDDLDPVLSLLVIDIEVGARAAPPTS